ncbi:MAG: YidC/Oxa1 family membrane protein insertase [Janthinobacterium sp.]|jgi:YidC/Oxa1 family membrane protein insertase
MSSLFHLVLTQPLANSLVLLYNHVTFQDLGLAIILLTIIIRFILYPLFYKSMQSQSMMQKIQPEIAKMQAETKGNREAQATAMMAIYKKNKINPFGSFFYLLLQLPILIAVYRLFNAGFNESTIAQLYSFVTPPENFSTMFLGLLDLSKPSMIIVAIAAVAQYIQGRLAMPKQKPGETQGKAASMGKYMVYMGPILTLMILPRLSSAIGLYWLVSSVFSIFQQRIINKKIYGTTVR